jgi:hypothetical protein
MDAPTQILTTPSRTSPLKAVTGALLLGTLGMSLFSGCMHPGPYDTARVGPLYTPMNHSGETNLGDIRRVVLMPIWAGATASAETASNFDPVIVTALQASQRFEVVTVSREDCLRRFRAESFSSAGALPHDLMATLQREFAADAVLFVDLTVFRAHRPLAMGLRAKLASFSDGRLVWVFDNLFSADDPAVANSVRNHFLDADLRVPADLTHSALQSPNRFAAYTTAAMFATLPPVVIRPAPIPTPAAKPIRSAR